MTTTWSTPEDVRTGNPWLVGAALTPVTLPAGHFAEATLAILADDHEAVGLVLSAADSVFAEGSSALILYVDSTGRTSWFPLAGGLPSAPLAANARRTREFRVNGSDVETNAFATVRLSRIETSVWRAERRAGPGLLWEQIGDDFTHALEPAFIGEVRFGWPTGSGFATAWYGDERTGTLT